VAKANPGIRFNEHIESDGPTDFAHAFKMGLEGIVSKRNDSAYRSGRSADWLKMKNSDAPAVKREVCIIWTLFACEIELQTLATFATRCDRHSGASSMGGPISQFGRAPLERCLRL